MCRLSLPRRFIYLLAISFLPVTACAEEAVNEGLVLWLDAAHVQLREGHIDQLTDRSGHARHAQRLADPKQVLANPVVVPNAANGQPVLRFDGRNSAFAFPEITDIRTVVWVISKDPEAFHQKPELFVLGGARTLDFHPGTHFTDTILHATPQYGARALQSGQAWLNGRLIDARATDFPQHLSVVVLQSTGNVCADQVARDRQFTDRCWHGDIAEILLFNRVLTAPEREQLQTHLMTKYGIPAESGVPTLPAPPSGFVPPTKDAAVCQG